MFAHSANLEVISGKTNELSMNKVVVNKQKEKFKLYFLIQNAIKKFAIASRICLIEYTARRNQGTRKRSFFNPVNVRSSTVTCEERERKIRACPSLFHRQRQLTGEKIKVEIYI